MQEKRMREDRELEEKKKKQREKVKTSGPRILRLL